MLTLFPSRVEINTVFSIHIQQKSRKILIIGAFQISAPNMENKTVEFVVEAHKESLQSLTLDSLHDLDVAYRSYYATEDYLLKLQSNFSQISKTYRYVFFHHIPSKACLMLQI